MSKMKWLAGTFLLGLVNHNAVADISTNVTVKVTITASPCTVNNNQTIDVDFGSNVAVTDVAAGLVEKDINYELDCSNMDTAKSLKMVIKGDGAEFDADVLKTSITDLGIEIKANGAKYPLNTAFNFANSEAKPALSALLVQKNGSRLDTGEFTAGATMMVDYQ